jgi:hypothetical protein
MNSRSTFLGLLLLTFSALCFSAEPTPMVSFDPTGACLLNNGVVTVAIDKQGQITSLKQGTSPNLIESGYLVGPYIRERSATTAQLVRNTPTVGEVAYAFRASNLDIELHYVILPETSGIYCYLELHHDPKKADAKDALGLDRKSVV